MILNQNSHRQKPTGDNLSKYRINPYHISTVCPKPNQVDPTRHGNEKYVPSVYRDPTEEAFSSEYIRRVVSRGSMTPGEKYRFPQTSNQEVGWYNAPVVKRPKTRLHYKPKGSCYETYFAVEYYKSTGMSPFKTKGQR